MMSLLPVRLFEPPSNLRVNDPCWCGSGRKFKKCHRDRDKQKSVNPYELEKEATSEFRRKYCSHPNASSDSCDYIIKSHTITKSSALKAISEGGHVYTGKTTFAELKRNNGKIVPKKVGHNLASTFTGFCGKHDNELFEPIEQGDFSLNEECVFLLSYRTVAFEFYQKEAELHTNKVFRDNLDKGWSLPRQLRFQSEMRERIRYSNIGVMEASISKSKYDHLLSSKDYDQLKFIAVRVDQCLPIVTSGGHFPEYDFEQNALFSAREQYQDPPLVLINLVNDSDGAIASLAWLRSDPRLNAFAENFVKMLTARGVDFLVQLGITSCDNTYYRPSWWESLADETRQKLCDSALSDVSPDVPLWYEAISDPVVLGLPGKVIDIVKKF